MGTPAALLIWPWITAQEVTGQALHMQADSFILGMALFIKESPAVKDLLYHLGMWFNGWIWGNISSGLASKYLDSFLGEGRGDGGVPTGESLPTSSAPAHSSASR
jgi:hypothetical protein